MGFLVSLSLRKLYRFTYQKIESLIMLPVYLILISLLATTIWYLSDYMISALFWEGNYFHILIKKISLKSFLKTNYVFFILMTAWGALYFGIKYALDWQNEKKRSAEAILLAQKAQMEMLRYQLNPHFLFNSLNSIRALVDEDKVIAKDMITELSEFLRYSLLHKDVTFVPLSNELEAVKHYFSIEKKRFEEKLELTYNITDDTKNCQILSFLLHPLIENAVKYGMKTSKMPLRISVTARKTDYGLFIEVCNSGEWIERNHANREQGGTGTGLSNVRKRLENAYNGGFKLDVSCKEQRVCIKIEIKEEYLHG